MRSLRCLIIFAIATAATTTADFTDVLWSGLNVGLSAGLGADAETGIEPDVDTGVDTSVETNVESNVDNNANNEPDPSVEFAKDTANAAVDYVKDDIKEKGTKAADNATNGAYSIVHDAVEKTKKVYHFITGSTTLCSTSGWRRIQRGRHSGTWRLNTSSCATRPYTVSTTIASRVNWLSRMFHLYISNETLDQKATIIFVNELDFCRC
ncbi:hypothetical protein Plhal304r1_c021g0075501 [Plasmopara halstedii]